MCGKVIQSGGVRRAAEQGVPPVALFFPQRKGFIKREGCADDIAVRRPQAVSRALVAAQFAAQRLGQPCRSVAPCPACVQLHRLAHVVPSPETAEPCHHAARSHGFQRGKGASFGKTRGKKDIRAAQKGGHFLA